MCFRVKNVFDCIDWIQQSVKDSVGWNECYILVAGLVSYVHGWIKDQTQLSCSEQGALEHAWEQTFISDFSKGVTQSTWEGKAGF